MGNILNKYFASVFTEEKLANIPKGSNLAMEGKLLSLVDIKISVDSIGRVWNIQFQTIDSLKLNKAGGIDELGTSLMKHTKEGILKPLLTIYQKSFEVGEVPLDWRLVNVTPIFKKGSKGEASNYRPV